MAGVTMRWQTGVVIDTRPKLMVYIELKSGKRFWCRMLTDVIRSDFVHVAWDYTRNKPYSVKTTEEFERLDTDEDREAKVSERLDVFSSPSGDNIDDEDGIGVDSFLSPSIDEYEFVDNIEEDHSSVDKSTKKGGDNTVDL